MEFDESRMPDGFEAGNPSQVTVTIVDDDIWGQDGCDIQPARLSVQGDRGFEWSGGWIDFTVSVDRDSVEPFTVDYRTEDVTATAGQDYTAKSGRLAFRPTGQRSQEVRVYLLDDDVEDGGETFKLVLHNPIGAVIEKAEGIGTIDNKEDDPRGGDPRRRSGGSAVGRRRRWWRRRVGGSGGGGGGGGSGPGDDDPDDPGDGGGGSGGGGPAKPRAGDGGGDRGPDAARRCGARDRPVGRLRRSRRRRADLRGGVLGRVGRDRRGRRRHADRARRRARNHGDHRDGRGRRREDGLADLRRDRDRAGHGVVPAAGFRHPPAGLRARAEPLGRGGARRASSRPTTRASPTSR